MNIPVWSGGSIAKDDTDGRYSPTVEFQNIVNQLLSEMQANLGPDGFVLPPQPASNVVSALTAAGEGAVCFDTDNKVWAGNDGTSIVKFMTTTYP